MPSCIFDFLTCLRLRELSLRATILTWRENFRENTNPLVQRLRLPQPFSPAEVARIAVSAPNLKYLAFRLVFLEEREEFKPENGYSNKIVQLHVIGAQFDNIITPAVGYRRAVW